MTTATRSKYIATTFLSFDQGEGKDPLVYEAGEGVPPRLVDADGNEFLTERGHVMTRDEWAAWQDELDRRRGDGFDDDHRGARELWLGRYREANA